MSSPLEAIGTDIWIADGPPVPFFGVPYPTRMVVARLGGGELWVWSPIALDAGLEEAVDALGPVRYLVSPNKLHHLYLGSWKRRWPEALLAAPPGLARKRADLSFDLALDDEAPLAWRDAIDQVVVRGSVAMEEVLFFHRASRTLLVGDLVQRFDPATLHGWRKLVMRLDGLVGDRGSTPREWRASFLRRESARKAVRRALAWGPERLVIAHGKWAPERGAQVLRDGLRWLRP